MIYVIMFIVGVVGAILAEEYLNSHRHGLLQMTVFCFAWMFIAVGFCGVGAGVTSGITDYAYFTQEKQKIEMLEKGIVDIKNATYETSTSKGTMISGSLENFKQSSTLSEYIKTVYEAKAEFNSNLIRSQFNESDSLMYWMYNGLFISDKVHAISMFK